MLTRVVALMVADALFAVLPMFVIWRLGRPLLEKMLISILMVLGVFAMTAVAFKLYYLRHYDPKSPDPFREILNYYIWVRLGEVIINIVACAPLLKVFIENGLHWLGLPRFFNSVRDLATLQSRETSANKDPATNTGVRMEVM